MREIVKDDRFLKIWGMSEKQFRLLNEFTSKFSRLDFCAEMRLVMKDKNAKFGSAMVPSIRLVVDNKAAELDAKRLLESYSSGSKQNAISKITNWANEKDSRIANWIAEKLARILNVGLDPQFTAWLESTKSRYARGRYETVITLGA